MFIPKYLQKISESVKTSRFYETVKIKCKCKSCQFSVYDHFEANGSNIKRGFNGLIQEDGKLYLVKRSFFGKILKKVECTGMFDKKERRVIKLKCQNCGTEYVIFDNYKNGYEAVLSPDSNKYKDLETPENFEEVYPEPLEVFVTIYQDLSYQDFKEDLSDQVSGINKAMYLDSFSCIVIYGKNAKSKKIKICTEETA